MPPPLNPAPLHILLALAAEDLHGYGIMQEISRQSQGMYKLGPGTLYDNLKKLMDQGLVVDAPKKSQDGDEKRRLRHPEKGWRGLKRAALLSLPPIPHGYGLQRHQQKIRQAVLPP